MVIVHERLRNQLLVGAKRSRAAEVVGWLGAVQAQDYAGARWAVAQRAGGLTSAAVDQELASGTIVRTHVLRPTWHLVAPQDVRWMLALTAPRLRTLMEYGNRRSGLTEAMVARAIEEVVRALTGGHRLTRFELGDRLLHAGVTTGVEHGLGRVLHRAEVDGVVCGGGLRGREHTYALLEEVVPHVEPLDRDSALTILAGRYYASHGPATIRDFAWWSGLSVGEARAGAEAAQPALERTEMDGRAYWASPSKRPPHRRPAPRAQLLPSFDEYTVAYADRSLVVEGSDRRPLPPFTLLSNVIVVDGMVLGTWKRTLGQTAVRITVSLFRSLAADEAAAVEAAAERYGRFLGAHLDVDVRFTQE